MKLKRFAGIAVGIVLLLCLAVGLTPVRGCGHLIRVHEMGGDYGEHPLPPEGATCANVGVVYPDNPVHGWPVPGTGWGDITAYYCDPEYYRMFGRTHWGIDISAPNGTPTVATATGTVIRAGYDSRMGNNVKFCTATGWCVIYMHLQHVAVQVGDQVSPGQLIGWVDNTGASTGPHLHYQINDPAGVPVDPAPTMY